jgi:hypothetical protein
MILLTFKSCFEMNKIFDVAIVGAGVSGVVTALQLANLGIDNVLFEEGKSVVNGPPFCHLHAGGNLYPDISEEQCKTLMKQSIDMAKLFPQSIDERPTLISIPKSENYEMGIIEQRLAILETYYIELIKEDYFNQVIGAPEDYYKIYTENDIIALVNQPSVERPKSADDWVRNAVKLIDYTQLKMPLILVQEYGWNLFRLGAQAQLALSTTDKCELYLETKINSFKDVRDQKLDYNWEVYTNDKVYKANYLVNSCGFKTGELDSALELNFERLIEFKAAYVSKWKAISGLIPELIFHGERGTPHGMAQLTPYCEDYYQIHGMTEEITLFKDGLVKSKNETAQPEFNNSIKSIMETGWEKKEVKLRTENAIKFVSTFIPSFKSAVVGGPPLYGAQQIPGVDANLRVGEVSFPSKFYARSEIVKASSALFVANQIIDQLQEEEVVSFIGNKPKENLLLTEVSKIDIDSLAADLATQRGYHESLSRLVIDKN